MPVGTHHFCLCLEKHRTKYIDTGESSHEACLYPENSTEHEIP